MRKIFVGLTALFVLATTQSYASQTIEQKENEMAEQKNPEPKIGVQFVYSLCNDIETMRHFYTELLGMKEIAYYNDNEQKFGYLSYLCAGDLEFDFFYAGSEAPVHKEWAWQPGYEGGTLPVPSWSVNVPEQDFPVVIKKLKEDGVKSFQETPYWCLDSYRAFDPMGNTVEVYSIPKEKPASTDWPRGE